MKTLSDRLKYALSKSGKTKTDIWRACGITSGAVTHWFDGTVKEMMSEHLIVTSKLLGVDPEWLATGKSSHKTSDRERLIRKAIDAMNRMRESDLRYISGLCERISKTQAGVSDRRCEDIGPPPGEFERRN